MYTKGTYFFSYIKKNREVYAWRTSVGRNFGRTSVSGHLEKFCSNSKPNILYYVSPFWPEIFILGVIYQPFELKIPPKLGLLKSKTMPKHFLNNSKTTSKKSRKRLFRPPKWPKHGCQLGQKCRFLGPFSLYELYFCLVGTKKFNKIVPPNG